MRAGIRDTVKPDPRKKNRRGGDAECVLMKEALFLAHAFNFTEMRGHVSLRRDTCHSKKHIPHPGTLRTGNRCCSPSDALGEGIAASRGSELYGACLPMPNYMRSAETATVTPRVTESKTGE